MLPIAFPLHPFAPHAGKARLRGSGRTVVMHFVIGLDMQPNSQGDTHPIDIPYVDWYKRCTEAERAWAKCAINRGFGTVTHLDRFEAVVSKCKQWNSEELYLAITDFCHRCQEAPHATSVRPDNVEDSINQFAKFRCVTLCPCYPCYPCYPPGCRRFAAQLLLLPTLLFHATHPPTSLRCTESGCDYTWPSLRHRSRCSAWLSQFATPTCPLPIGSVTL